MVNPYLCIGVTIEYFKNEKNVPSEMALLNM